MILYFISYSYDEDELPMYVDRLHKYNEIKDIAQSVIGRIGKNQFHFYCILGDNSYHALLRGAATNGLFYQKIIN